MGKDFIDSSTTFHFLGGVLSRISIFPNNKVCSYVISILLHGFIELIEKSPNPYTGTIESIENHIGDMVFFILGMLFGECFNNLSILTPEIRGLALFVILTVSFKEIVREFIDI